jgi:hypothetical protein
MTRFTEAHQVALCVLVLGEHHQLLNVVNVYCEGDYALALTVDAQGMTLQVAESEPLPCSVVSTLGC